LREDPIIGFRAQEGHQGFATDSRVLASIYLNAKQAVVQAGFLSEIDWQGRVRAEDLTESQFLREAAWTVLSAGMNESIIRKHFPAITDAFMGWSSAVEIADTREVCRRRALAVFRHRAKINAIIAIAQKVAALSIDWIRHQVLCYGVHYLRRFPFIGPVTSFHLAKNIGLPVAKPDRHLVTIARLLGAGSVQTMCESIAEETCDPVPVIDVVFWRYARENRGYRDELRRWLATESIGLVAASR